MLYDFIELDRASSQPLCGQLYLGLRTAIEDGSLAAGEKLASIRQACTELSVSRTTVETAYARLCMEGYADSKPQSGYRVRRTQQRPAAQEAVSCWKPLYDFSTAITDNRAADIENWKKLLRAVLSDSEAVTSYGDAQGERCLRENLAGYAFRARGVIARPECIFIGAGVGPLLQLLCPLFGEKLPVFMESPGFSQAEEIFRDYDFPLKIPRTIETEYEKPLLPQAARAIAAELPSLRPRMSSSAASARRALLGRWVRLGEERYVLEDDYNGELRYKTRALPAFQGSCPERTIYLGSFSKLLVPSVRIAYMVLPPALAQRAQRRMPVQNQTAGKIEQLALAEYIRTGLLEKHLRRLRRLNLKKSQLMLDSLSSAFGERAECTLFETHLSVLITLSSNESSHTLCDLARSAGILCSPAPGFLGDRPQVSLSFSGIEEERIPQGIAALKKAWEKVI